MEQGQASSKLDDLRTIWVGSEMHSDPSSGPDLIVALEDWLKRRAIASGIESVEDAARFADEWQGLPSQIVLSVCAMRKGVVIEKHPITDGYVEVVRSEPVVTQTSTPFIYFSLLSVPGVGELLRENHGFGYHFHFSNDGRDRADILLTFSRIRSDTENPVTWEPHAVGKADFAADVHNWGNGKRGKVHDVCMTDKRKRKLGDYVHPGKNFSFLLP